MRSRMSYLRVGLATSLSVALGAPSVTSVMAAPDGASTPMWAVLQDSNAAGQSWDPTPRPVAIHAGTLSALGDDVAELNSLVAPDGQAIGSDDRGRTEYAYTPNIPLGIGQLTSDDHVIIIELSDLNDRVIAFGQIGGVQDANGSLVVNLVAGDDVSDVYGTAVLTPNGPNSTAASIFISGSSLGDDDGSRTDDDDRDHDNDGRNDDDADDDGIRDDDDDDDDDDGRLDDDDDDDDGDGRTDDDDGTDDDGAGGGGVGGGSDDGGTDDGGGFVGDGGTDDGGQFDDGTTDDGGGVVGDGGSGGSGGGGGSGGS